MKPVEILYQFGRELYAIGVDNEAALVHLAVTGGDIKVTAGGGGEKNGSGIVFQLLKTAGSALMAEFFPCGALQFLIVHCGSILNPVVGVNVGKKTGMEI